MSAQNTSTLKDEPLSSRASASLEASQARGAAIPELNDKGRMADIPLSPEAKITVERRGEIVLIGSTGRRSTTGSTRRLSSAWPRRTTTSTTIPTCGRRCSSATARISPAASTLTPSRPWPRPASRSR